MEITFFQKNLAPKEEAFFADYVKQKRKSIENLLGKFASDAKLLKASIEKYKKHDAFEVELCLVLPQKSIIAKEVSHQITKAVDLSKDRLISQIKKHIANLRGDRTHKSIRKEEPIKVNPFVEAFGELQE